METLTHFSLQAETAILSDICAIQNCHLEYEVDFLNHQKWPEFIKELCTLGKALESTLITGVKLVVSAEFPLAEGSHLPRFCYDLFSQILTEDGLPRYMWDADRRSYKDSDGRKSNDGLLISKKASHCVFLLRQVLLAFSKAKDIEPVTDPKSELESFKRRLTGVTTIKANTVILATARKLLHEFFYDSEGRLHPFLEQWRTEPWGRHGPGAVAEREKGLEKWNFIVDALRLTKDIYRDSSGDDIGKTGSIDATSRVCQVPKDFRGRRIICIEPKEFQYAQQALFTTLTDMVHSHPLTRGCIDFKDQSRSFWFSKGLENVSTIDLKDASDMVSLRLCKLLFPKEVLAIFTRYRTSHVEMPDGEIIRNSNTAFTMGNALCFPIETLVFWSLAAATMITENGRQLPVCGSFKLPLRVFGDDIVIESRHCEYLIRVLEDCGLVVNHNKTCHRSLVREACGSWWFAHTDVRITKLKFSEICNLEAWTSIEDVIEQQLDNGLVNFATLLRACCDKVYPTKLTVLLMSGDEAEVRRKYLRFNAATQLLEYKRPIFVATNKVALPGRIGLTAWFTSQSTSSVYSSTQRRIKYAWVPVN